MPILSITTELTGEIGVTPRLVRITCNDTYSTITAQNYLLPEQHGLVYSLDPTDFIAVSYSGGFGWFNPVMSNGNITMVATPAPGSAVLPVTSGDFAVFDGTEGLIQDLGYSPTNASKTKVVMANGATVVKNLASFSDISGTIQDSGARILSGVTPVFNGGSSGNTFTVTGMTASCVGSAIINQSTNNVSLTKVVPATNSLIVTFSGDPGAATALTYIYTTAAQT